MKYEISYEYCKHKIGSTLFVHRAKGKLAKIQNNRDMHIECSFSLFARMYTLVPVD